MTRYPRSITRIIRDSRRQITISNKKATPPLPSPQARRPEPKRDADKQIILRPPPSLKDNPLISIHPPGNATPPPPAWMLKFFPHFFKAERLQDLGPEEHNHPYGAPGVYGKIATYILAFGLFTAHLYERFFTDSMEMTRIALQEQRVREELEKLLQEKSAQ